MIVVVYPHPARIHDRALLHWSECRTSYGSFPAPHPLNGANTSSWHCAKAVAATVETTCKPQVYTYFRKEFHKKQTNLCRVTRKGSSRVHSLNLILTKFLHFISQRKKRCYRISRVASEARLINLRWHAGYKNVAALHPSSIHDGAGNGRRCSISSSQIY